MGRRVRRRRTETYPEKFGPVWDTEEWKQVGRKGIVEVCLESRLVVGGV